MGFDLEDGIKVLKFTSEYEYKPIYFYGPVITGIVISLILFVFVLIYFNKKFLISFALQLSIVLVMVLSVYIAFDLSNKNYEILYTDCTVKLTGRMSAEQLDIDYHVIQENEDGTYVIRLYW